MIPEEVLDRAEKVAQQAEVYALSYEETPVGFEANRLKQLQTRQGSGLALRVIVDGRIGFASTTRQDGADDLVAAAVELAQFGAEAKFQMPGPGRYPQVEVYDPAVEQVSVEQMVHLGQSLIDRVRQRAPELLCEGGVVKRTSTVRLLNSQGGSATYRKSVMGISMEGSLIRGTDMLFVGDSESSCHPITDTSKVARETLRQLELAREIVPAPSGQLPVVFTPRGVAGVFIMPLAMAFNGRSVLQGSSPLGHQQGQKAFNKRLSLWDDPTLAYRPGSRACDDEGVPAQRMPLIQDGVVGNFLYDLQTAGLAGTRSTGSASRALGSLPSPGTSVLVISPGEASFDDLVAEVQEGLVVEQLLGATQGNILGGDFSGNVLLGYKIEKGRIIGRVKDTMIAGNIYAMLKEDIALGREAQWVGGSLLTPPIACARVGVAAKG